MTSARPRTALVALAAVAALGLGACSSGDDGSSSSSKSTDGTERTTTTTAGDDTGTTAAKGGSDDTVAGPGDGRPLKRYAAYKTKSYDDATHWVCRPDTADDVCHGDLDSTAVAADGTLTVEPFERAEDPPIDCFYVYPTISRDQSQFSDWEASDDEEGFVTLNQAARLASQCRVFAPVYRQRTLAGLAGALGGGAGTTTSNVEQQGDPFADVLDAFRTYMAQDNEGRGVVLIGHSQGAGLLNQLIQEEIDPNEDVRAQLVGAYLAGGTVAVPDGEKVGGDFENVPLCRAPDEIGCVATWATFRSTATPPENSFFGKPRGSSDGVAGCVNPAAPDGGSAEAHSYFPADAKASILSSLGTATTGEGWVEGAKVTTPYVSVPGLVSTTCATNNGFTYLEATVHGDPADPRADDIPGDLTPQWGLHLVDVNLVMGDVVDMVAAQADTYES